MSVAATRADGTFPPVFADAVRVAVERTCTSISGAAPVAQPTVESAAQGPCVIGIISFLGEIPWTLSWVLTRDTAVSFIEKFVGFEIPFDSSDMGDAVGELVNVVAGDIVAELDKRRIKAAMSLPTVIRGAPLEILPDKGAKIRFDFSTKHGDFWLQLATVQSNRELGRKPGT